MLTNPRTRLEISQVHQTWHHSICQVYSFLLVCYTNLVPNLVPVFEISDLQVYGDLETRVRVNEGHLHRHVSIRHP